MNEHLFEFFNASQITLGYLDLKIFRLSAIIVILNFSLDMAKLKYSLTRRTLKLIC